MTLNFPQAQRAETGSSSLPSDEHRTPQSIFILLSIYRYPCFHRMQFVSIRPSVTFHWLRPRQGWGGLRRPPILDGWMEHTATM